MSTRIRDASVCNMEKKAGTDIWLVDLIHCTKYSTENLLGGGQGRPVHEQINLNNRHFPSSQQMFKDQWVYYDEISVVTVYL